MHPPRFRMTQRLSDWPECVIELHCCAGMVGYPVRLLMQRCGNITFENLLKRLRCKRCRRFKPAPVYLVAGHHRSARNGPDADWSVELVPPPRVGWNCRQRALRGGRIKAHTAVARGKGNSFKRQRMKIKVHNVS